jgi:hypothetical protein
MKISQISGWMPFATKTYLQDKFFVAKYPQIIVLQITLSPHV